MARIALHHWIQRNHHRFARLVALDVRSLSLLRIALGALILIDLGLRAQDLIALYSDHGVLPLSQTPPPSQLALLFAPHFLAHTPTEVGVVFGLAALAAIGLTIGYHTRWMIVLSWILLHSLQSRNPFVNHAGDKVLLLMLFWAAFLPLDHHFRPRVFTKHKANRNACPPRMIASWATTGILLQFASIYLMGALRKTGETWWNGSAVWYTLQIDQYARPWTRDLLNSQGLLEAATWLTLAIEFVAPILLFTGTGWLRRIAVCLIALLHLGFLLCLDLGLFPYISMGVCIFAFPWGTRRESGPDPITIPPLTMGNRVAGYLAATLVFWNIATLRWYPEEIKEILPSPIRAPFELVRLDQYWSMFAPNPMTIDGWYVITEQEQINQRGINLLGGDESRLWEKPAAVTESFPSDRWKEYLMTLSDAGDPPQLWKNVVTFLASEHNAKTSSPVNTDRLRVVYMMERSTPKGEASPEPEQAWPREDSF